MRGEGARRSLRQLLERSGDDVPLAEAALLIAAHEYPDLPVDTYLQKLHDLGERALEAAKGADSVPDAIGQVRRLLFQDCGFRANTELYYDPKNSYLNEVIDRKLGIPITLSIVYLDVAQRAGLAPKPIGFPGHFLVKHEMDVGALVLDPFHGARSLGESDLRRMLEPYFGDRARTANLPLDEATPREVLLRLLRNLQAIYLRADDGDRALGCTDLMLSVDPTSLDLRRDRAVLRARRGELDGALSDLVQCARAMPEGDDLSALRRMIEALRAKRASLN